MKHSQHSIFQTLIEAGWQGPSLARALDMHLQTIYKWAAKTKLDQRHIAALRWVHYAHSPDEFQQEGGIFERGVYYLKAGRSVKIGVTQNLPKRIETLQVGNPIPLELIAWYPFELESVHHGKWQRQRIQGTEWFRYAEGMASPDTLIDLDRDEDTAVVDLL